MLSFHIATIHPEFIEAYKKFGVFQAAEKKSLASIEAINKMTEGFQRQLDDDMNVVYSVRGREHERVACFERAWSGRWLASTVAVVRRAAAPL